MCQIKEEGGGGLLFGIMQQIVMVAGFGYNGDGLITGIVGSDPGEITTGELGVGMRETC